MDTRDDYNVRLNAGSYCRDVQCQFRLVPNARDERAKPMESWISERLLSRLMHLGFAYELPFLKRLPETGHWTYPEIQLPDLQNELAFLFTVVSDDLLLNALLPVREMIGVAMCYPRGWLLVVERP